LAEVLVVKIIGVECEDGSRRVHYHTDSFDDACKRMYAKYPNYLSILELRIDEVDEFLNFKWEDQE
jgi:hypothetical protein